MTMTMTMTWPKLLVCLALCGGLCAPAAGQMLEWRRVPDAGADRPASQAPAIQPAQASMPSAAPAVSALSAAAAPPATLSARASPYTEVITDVARHYAIDPLLVHAVIEAESAYRPAAVSDKGAQGLMQVMPATGARFGKTALTQPRDNIEAGVAYLSWLMRRFDGRLDLVMAGYNAGEGAVARYGNVVPPYVETQAYVHKVLTRYAALNGKGGSATLKPTTAFDGKVGAVRARHETVRDEIASPARVANSTNDLNQLLRLFIGGSPRAVTPGFPS